MTARFALIQHWLLLSKAASVQIDSSTGLRGGSHRGSELYGVGLCIAAPPTQSQPPWLKAMRIHPC